MTTPMNYVEPPDVPEGMTLADYRRMRLKDPEPRRRLRRSRRRRPVPVPPSPPPGNDPPRAA